MQTPRVFLLTQPAAAVAKDIHLHCGWRPSMVRGFTNVGSWVKVDGLGDDNEEVMLYPHAAAFGASDDDADDICQLTENGFKLGGNTTYVRANDLVMRIIAYPPGYAGPHVATLDDAKIGAYSEPFGDGEQFDATPQDSGNYNWISLE